MAGCAGVGELDGWRQARLYCRPPYSPQTQAERGAWESPSAGREGYRVGGFQHLGEFLLADQAPD